MIIRTLSIATLSLSIYTFSMHHYTINPLSIRQACLDRYATNLTRLTQEGLIAPAQRTLLANRFNAARAHPQTFADVQTTYFMLIRNVQPILVNNGRQKS